jgi:N-methylhydantoinase A
MSFKIGVDVGGTFTDFLLFESEGGTEVYKVLSTPDDPSRAVMEGLSQMAAAHGLELRAFLTDVEIIVHGTTVTTNAVITGRIARTGLLTTRGFRDALQMRRGIREVQYDNKYRPPDPLVPRRLRRPVTERVDFSGAVLRDIDLADVDDAVTRFMAEDVEAVAICFLHAYARDDHERAAAARLAEAMPDAYLSVSTDVLPQVRFYERVSTTVLNAGVGPVLRLYLNSLAERLEEAGFRGVLLIMQSNGGVTTPAIATELAASTLLSGPAAAPVAGLAYGELHDARDFITIDMGGTSFDATLAKDGTPSITTEGRVSGHALGLATMEITTIGAGGGSIAWIDDGGMLRMGPQSAGASPGPVCYGLGGTEPTCSDANLVLGYLNPDYFAGGRMRLDREATKRAIAEKIAAPLGVTPIEAAYGMFHLMNVNMATAMREISVQKGYDPREFLLICAGGAGPIHAAHIANELEIPRILIPGQSSIFCAAGMLYSDLKHGFVRSYHTDFSEATTDREQFQQLLQTLRTQGDSVLASEGIPLERRRYRYSLDLRYRGQYHEVNVEVAEHTLAGPDFVAITEAFHRAHDRLYGYALDEEGTEIDLVNVRMTAIGISEKPELHREPLRRNGIAELRKGRRPVYLPSHSDFAAVDVYDGDAMGHGHALDGPAILEQRNTTVFVPNGYRVRCDALGSYLLTVE